MVLSIYTVFQSEIAAVSNVSTLVYEHINLTGDYIWRNNKKLGEGKYVSLRPVDVRQYKKQP